MELEITQGPYGQTLFQHHGEPPTTESKMGTENGDYSGCLIYYNI